MSMTYKVKINNKLELDITHEEISKMDAIKTSVSKYHILQNNTSYQAEITNSDFNKKKYTVTVNNNTYDVAISNALELLIKAMGLSSGSSKHINSVKSPMPGLMLDINVQVGQEVKEDDTLLILEAMKMENIITSPRDGIIKSISATIGDAIDKGQLLIEFE
ncbi:MAG: acetyl-CoA carboxylase biotin carboxyl carrier protein subunit [Flavobacteriaceae bacterium]|nr:acetyl-CoA carboxylase biotin carboxyl carrier protein subunit [Flavobacteriaceae bacterium]